MATYSAGSATLDIIPSMKGFHRDLSRQLGGFNPQVAVGADMSSFTKSVRRATSQVPSLKMRVEIGKEQIKAAEKEVERAEGAIRAARERSEDATKRVDIAEKQLDETRKNTSAKASQIASAEMKVTQARRASAAAAQEVKNAEDRLSGAKDSVRTVRTKVEADTTGASAHIRAWAAGVSAGTQVSIDVVADTGRVMRELAALRAAAQITGVVSLSLVGLGAVASGIAVIPGLIAAASVPFGALVVASQGVIDTLQEQQKASENAAQTAVQDAQRQIQATRSISDAERGLQRAREDGARSVQRAQQRAAWSAAAAARSVMNAERQLSTAQKASRQAQMDLTRAREEAADVMRDLNFQVRGGMLDEREAILAVEQAERELASARSLHLQGSEMDQVVLNLEQQQLALEEVRARNGDLAKEQAAAQRNGIEGSAQVVAAKNAEAQANQGVVDAQRSLVDAQRQATQDQITSQQSIADAQRQATQSTADAQRQLARAVQDASLAAAANIDMVQQKMAQLSPAAQQFVNTIEALKPAFTDMRLSVQEAFFSGLGPALQDWATAVLPTMKQGLTDVAGAMNGVAKETLGFLSSTPVINQFQQLFTALQPVISATAPLIQSLIGAFLHMATAAMPAIEQLLGHVTNFFNYLGNIPADLITSGISGLVSVIGAMLEIIAPLIPLGLELMTILGPPLVATLQALQPAFDALGQIMIILAPVIGQIAQIFATQLSNALVSIIPLVEKFAAWAGANPEVAASLLAVAVGFGAVLGPLASLFTWVSRLFKAFGGLGGSLGRMGGVFRGLLGPIGVIVGIFATMFAQSEAFRNAVFQLMSTLGNLVMQIMTALKPAFDSIMNAFNTLIQALIPPLMAVMNALMPVITMLAGFIGQLFQAVAPLVATFGNLLKTILPPLIDIISAVLVPVIQFLARVLKGTLAVVLNGIILPVFRALTWALNNVGSVFNWLWKEVIEPVWTFISDKISWVWDNVLKPVFDAIGVATYETGKFFQTMGDKVTGVWEWIKSIVHGGIQGIIDFVWNDGIRALWVEANDSFLGGIIPDPPPKVIIPKFATGGMVYGPGNGTSDSILARLSNGEFVMPAAMTERYRAILELMRIGKYAAGGIVGNNSGKSTVASNEVTAALEFNPSAFDTLDTSAAGTASTLELMSDTITDTVNPSMAAMQRSTQVSAKSVRAEVNGLASRWNLYTRQHRSEMTNQTNMSRFANTQQLNSTRNAQTGMTNSIRSNVTAQNNAQVSFRNGLTASRNAMTNTADWAVQQFARMRGAAADPIRWVMQQPINRGIIAAWNKLNGDFGLGKHVGMVPVGFSSGGYTGDGGMFEPKGVVHGGEFVIRKKITRHARPFLEALNSGNPEALQATGGPRAKLRGYARGGLVANTGGAVNAAVARGVRAARSLDGKRYVWGGSDLAGVDCSGYMSVITNALLDERNIYRRRFTTASFGNGRPAGFTPGLTSAFAIGNTPGSHMAGTLAGVNVESGGAHRTSRYGGPAVGADHRQFSVRASLPVVGGKFIGGKMGESFDPSAIVDEAFRSAYDQIGQTGNRFPGNIAGHHAAGIARVAADRVKGKAVDRIGSMMSTSSSSAAGSPEVVAAVRAVANQFGWSSGPQWDALNWLIGKESSWNPAAANPNSSARGLFQKMTSLHGPLESTIDGQAHWGLNYIKNNGNFSDPIGAKRFHMANNWYDQGGHAVGKGFMMKDVLQPERVLSPNQTRSFDRLVSYIGSGMTVTRGDAAPSGGPFIENLNVHENPNASAGQLIGAAMTKTRHFVRSNRSIG